MLAYVAELLAVQDVGLVLRKLANGLEVPTSDGSRISIALKVTEAREVAEGEGPPVRPEGTLWWASVNVDSQNVATSRTVALKPDLRGLSGINPSQTASAPLGASILQAFGKSKVGVTGLVGLREVVRKGRLYELGVDLEIERELGAKKLSGATLPFAATLYADMPLNQESSVEPAREADTPAKVVNPAAMDRAAFTVEATSGLSEWVSNVVGSFPLKSSPRTLIWSPASRRCSTIPHSGPKEIAPSCPGCTCKPTWYMTVRSIPYSSSSSLRSSPLKVPASAQTTAVFNIST